MSPGQIAFEAYNNAGANPGLTWDKKPVPAWENLSDDVRAKWAAAELAVIAEHESSIANALARDAAIYGR